MTTKFLVYGQLITSPLLTHLRLLQARLDELLIRTEAETGDTKKGKLPTWAIILIVILAVSIGLVLCCVGVIAILTLMGPEIGNIFSDMVQELESS